MVGTLVGGRMIWGGLPAQFKKLHTFLSQGKELIDVNTLDGFIALQKLLNKLMLQGTRISC